MHRTGQRLGWWLIAMAGLAMASWAQPLPTPAPPAIPYAEPPITVMVKPVSNQPVRIGDPANFIVTLEAVSPAAAGSPDFGKKIGPWDVLEIKPGPWQRMVTGHLQRQDQLTLTTYEPGEVEFPAIVLKFKRPDGQEGEFRSAAFKVKVLPLAARPGDKPGQLRGLKSPIGLLPLWLVILVLALLGLAGYLIWRFEKERASSPEAAAWAAPPRPAEVVARERLAALQQSDWLSQDQMKPYYSELADILRRYLEARLNIPASDRTTPELFRELKATRLKRTDLAEVRDVLEASDMAKFAKAQPTQQEAETHWQQVADLVERTTLELAQTMDNNLAKGAA